MRIFLAGATGAIGLRLIRLIVGAGHEVTGATRSRAKLDGLRAAGVKPVLVDVFDAGALINVVGQARPDVVIHQLTDLPKDLQPSQMGEAIKRNARIRDEGTRNLVAAAKAAGAKRLIAQSIAWAFAPGHEPYNETSPLDAMAEGARSITVSGVISLERQVLETGTPEGVVLRYGQIYGPRTGRELPDGSSPLHVDAAAYAALLAIDHGSAGIYNIVEENPHVIATKAVDKLGWRPSFRLSQ